MALQQTPSGLQIQSIAEIVDDLRTAYADPTSGFGADVKVQGNDPFGILIANWAEREALLQQLLQAIQSGFDPAAAAGTDLDTLRSLTGSFRKNEFQSQSASGQLNGTNGTVIVDGAQIRNEDTQDLWQLVDGPGGSYTIPVGGFIACTIQAVEPGPKTFETGTVWSIVTPVPGWTSFQTTADIDPEDTGRDDETDVTFRERSEADLFVRGNDLQAIKANVLRVDTVTLVSMFENRDCTQTVDGIPPGAFETLVDGGDDTAIAEAILEKKPPGAEAFGSTIVPLTDLEGNPIDVGFTRPSDVDIGVDVYYDTTNAEVPLPDNFQDLIKQAVLDHGQATAQIGSDVITESFKGPVFDVLQDPVTLKYPITGLRIETQEIPGIADENNIPIDNRSRADYDTANIGVFDETPP